MKSCSLFRLVLNEHHFTAFIVVVGAAAIFIEIYIEKQISIVLWSAQYFVEKAGEGEREREKNENGLPMALM